MVKKATDRGLRRWRAVALLAVGVMIGVSMVATPAGAHVGGTVGHLWNDHIKPKADPRYANAVAGTDKAKDADMLDGVDSAGFQRRCQLGAVFASGFVASAGASVSEASSCLGDGTLAVTKLGTGVYEVDTNGFGCAIICSGMNATVSPSGTTAATAVWTTDRVGESGCDPFCFGGEIRLIVRTFNSAGVAADNAFSFAIFS